MRRYFQKQDGSKLTRYDYNVLCIRFAAEVPGGCPIFGPFNSHIFEFTRRDGINAGRLQILENAGYVEVDEPQESERVRGCTLEEALPKN